MSILRSTNLYKKHDSGFSLDIAHMEFQKGKIYGLVGPNGAGKSTLLNILNLLEEPAKGDIYFYDQKVTRANSLEIRRKMSMVMEDPFLFKTTVYKNLTAGLSCRSIDKKKWTEMVDEVLKLVGLEGFQKRHAPALSRGESQRVAIARALILQPDLLLLDEPFTNIDVKNVKSLEKLIITINETYDTTIIFTTHDFSQAYCLSDEVISLVGGKIIKGPLDNLFEGVIEAENGLQFVKISSKTSVSIVTEKRGKVHLSIPPLDIILSHEKIFSSARNSFKGKVKKIQIEGQTVDVWISVDDEIEVIALITNRSYKEMKLSIDSDVFLTFKSTSVMVF